ncbi:MAG: hypothetical protein EZS28_011958 [Streblomastix strix]|uniref:Uncharacterized protein n=1 Tax=Streblomastix strix TaxID=222440 RepID=A0A5J4WC46_9EUKA|nr:MAG: hypothetical protein EZS28_011958 [Streblomastix strix]
MQFTNPTLNSQNKQLKKSVSSINSANIQKFNTTTMNQNQSVKQTNQIQMMKQSSQFMSSLTQKPIDQTETVRNKTLKKDEVQKQTPIVVENKAEIHQLEVSIDDKIQSLEQREVNLTVKELLEQSQQVYQNCFREITIRIQPTIPEVTRILIALFNKQQLMTKRIYSLCETKLNEDMQKYKKDVDVYIDKMRKEQDGRLKTVHTSYAKELRDQMGNIQSLNTELNQTQLQLLQTKKDYDEAKRKIDLFMKQTETLNDLNNINELKVKKFEVQNIEYKEQIDKLTQILNEQSHLSRNNSFENLTNKTFSFSPSKSLLSYSPLSSQSVIQNRIGSANTIASQQASNRIGSANTIASQQASQSALFGHQSPTQMYQQQLQQSPSLQSPIKPDSASSVSKSSLNSNQSKKKFVSTPSVAQHVSQLQETHHERLRQKQELEQNFADAEIEIASMGWRFVDAEQRREEVGVDGDKFLIASLLQIISETQRKQIFQKLRQKTVLINEREYLSVKSVSDDEAKKTQEQQKELELIGEREIQESPRPGSKQSTRSTKSGEVQAVVDELPQELQGVWKRRNIVSFTDLDELLNNLATEVIKSRMEKDVLLELIPFNQPQVQQIIEEKMYENELEDEKQEKIMQIGIEFSDSNQSE